MARKVGFFHNGNKASFEKHYAVFVNRLYDFIGQSDVEIIESWAGGQGLKPLHSHIQDLMGEGVDVIVAAGGPPSAQAAQQATLTQKVPVVFMSVADPHKLGLVGEDYSRPGTNMTGIAGMTSELDLVRLKLLREFLDHGKPAKIGVLNNAGRPNLEEQYKVLQDAAPGMTFTLVRKDVENLPGIEAAIKEFKGDGCNAILVTADSLFNNLRKDVVACVNRVKIPAIYQWREFAEAGGLMSFGANIMEAYAKVGEYVGLILDGASPAELPVSFPERFEFVINLRVAHASGFAIPPGLLARAEFVSERLRPSSAGKPASKAQ